MPCCCFGLRLCLRVRLEQLSVIFWQNRLQTVDSISAACSPRLLALYWLYRWFLCQIKCKNRIHKQIKLQWKTILKLFLPLCFCCYFQPRRLCIAQQYISRIQSFRLPWNNGRILHRKRYKLKRCARFRQKIFFTAKFAKNFRKGRKKIIVFIVNHINQSSDKIRTQITLILRIITDLLTNH